MNYLSLQIDGQWAYLTEGTEIVLEGNNPIFSDAGSKTYLFQLHVESNRHLFGNADDIYGDSYYKVLDGKPATLYVADIPIMVGKVSLEDEVYMDDDGCIAINLVSGNLEFAQMIEGMNCRDVEQAEEVEVGISLDNITLQMIGKNGEGVAKSVTFDFPDEFIFFTKDNEANISHAYPEKNFCNIRLCSQYVGDDDFNSILGERDQNILRVFSDSSNAYEIFEASRRGSGICFYVQYFLRCLFKKLKLEYTDGVGVGDINRLAMVNLRCDVKREGNASLAGMDIFNSFGVTDFWPATNEYNQYYYGTKSLSASKAIATSENFPDAEVSKIIESLYTAFGVVFINDSSNGTVKSMFIKDVLKSRDANIIPCEVFKGVKVESNKVKGFTLSYDGGEDDANYNYYDFSDMERHSSYSGIISAISANKKSCMMDTRTGNAYKVFVYGDDADESDLKPALLEVGAFNDAKFGDCSNDGCVEKIVIPFTPIINNDVGYVSNESRARASNRQEGTLSDNELENKYALFIDEEIEKPKTVKVSHEFRLTKPGTREYLPLAEMGYKYISFQGENFSNTITHTSFTGSASRQGSDSTSRKSILLTDSTIINSHNVGLMFGIMRGPGSGSKMEEYDYNFDGEGNSRVAFTSANYAFTSDSVDNCNRDFDYNGTGEGGVDYDGRFSLKLRAGKFDKDGNPIKDSEGKPIVLDADRAERGLYDKFWKEYAYFTVNKKILRLTCRMEIADILAIDWTKRHKIGEHVGFISSYSYSVNTSGMSDVEIELYYI